MARRTTRQPRTITEQATANLYARRPHKSIREEFRAARDGMQAVQSLSVLARLWRRNGQMPTQVAYCTELGVDERTAQRHWALIREAFPGLPVPEDQAVEYLTRHVRDQLRDDDQPEAAISFTGVELVV
jgi:hypothetical protein